MKQGDLVEIVERTMGMYIPSGNMGVIVRNAVPSEVRALDMWEILVNGVVKIVSRGEIRLVKSIECR